MSKIWVKAAHPRASFYQEVLEPNDEGGPAELRIEHVHAPTHLQDGHPSHGKQVPVPMEITDTHAVRIAINERFPGTDMPARIVACTAEEVAAHKKARGIEDDDAEKAPAKSKKAAAAVRE